MGVGEGDGEARLGGGRGDAGGAEGRARRSGARVESMRAKTGAIPGLVRSIRGSIECWQCHGLRAERT